MISAPKATGSDIPTIFNVCLSAIGGNQNPSVQHYFSLRNQKITRDAFFQQALWAVWVAGMARKAARTFLDNIQFNYDFRAFAALNENQLTAFIAGAHPSRNNRRAMAKWHAIHAIASWLTSFKSDADFRKRFFGDKTCGDELDAVDVQRILTQGLPFIGWANSHFIVKNLGGQAIKPDRWINEFLSWGNLNQAKLESRLKRHNIPLSLFDTAIWSYCEMFIGRAANLHSHFTAKFGVLV